MKTMALNFKHSSFKVLSGLVITLAVLWMELCQNSLYGQEVKTPPYHHWSLESGLPSNEIYHIIESSRGHIWIATDNGVAKYDGKEFTFFRKKNGLTDNVVFKLFEDDKGIIWCTTHNNRICKILPNDSIVPYEWNDKLEKAIPKHLAASMVAISLIVSNDSLVIGYKLKGAVAIGSDGGYRLLHNDKGLTLHNIKSFGEYSIQFSYPSPKKAISINGYEVNFNMLSDLNSKNIDYGYSCRLKDGKLVGTYGNAAFIENSRGDFNPLFFPEPIIYTTQIDDLLWFGTLNNGVYAFELNENKWVERYHFFQGSSVSTILKDKNHGYWFATHESGIYYLSNFSYQSVSICNEVSNIYDVEVLNGFIFTMDSEQEIQVYDKKDFSLIEFIDTAFISSSFYRYDESFGNSFLGIRTNESSAILTNGKSRSTMNSQEENFLFYIQFISEHQSLNITSKEKITLRNHLTGKDKTIQGKFGTSNAFVFDDLIITVGNVGYGIYTITGDSLYFKNRDLLNEQIQQVKQYSHGIYCSSKSGCIYKYDSNTYVFKKFYCLDRLNLLDFEIDKEQIWLATTNGLLKMKEGETEKYWEESVKFITVSEENVLFATNKDLIMFKDYQKVDNAAVFVASHAVNGIKTERSNLETSENNLTFTLGIKYPIPEKEYKIQAVLIGSDTIVSDLYGKSISYPQLSSGNYEFYFRNLSNGTQSETMLFTIKAPFWQQWWFIVGVISLFVITGLLIIAFIYRRHEKKTQLESQLIELRSKALRAQMNPHFIFNVMNVIQSFISSKKLNESSDVLVKLSKLIRNALNYSKHETITLAQELSFCEDYFNLENLRVKGKMRFKLNVANTIDLSEIIIPPLTVQPILENAIIHGLSPMNGEGQITIDILDRKKFIEIIVKDTGVGYSPDVSQSTHESHGIKMVSDRITILDKRNSVLINKNEQTTGTNVKITLYNR